MGTKDWTAAKLVECLSDNLPLSSEQRAILVTLVVQREQQDKDAERYRWLRSFAPTEVEYDHTDRECGLTLYIPCDWSDDPKLDDAVDAVMAATPVFGAA